MSDNLPEMVPSARERRDAAHKAALKQWDDEQHDKPWPAATEQYIASHEIRALEEAFRDGALAERARIVAMLREPSDAFVCAAAQAEFAEDEKARRAIGCVPFEWPGIGNRFKDNWLSRSRAGIRTLADLIEGKP